MNIFAIIGLVLWFSGGICSVVAGILYNTPIQRYLEKLGKSPAFFLFSWSGLEDYWNAKKLAKRWGHSPQFLKRYGQLLKIAFALMCAGSLLLLLSMA